MSEVMFFLVGLVIALGFGGMMYMLTHDVFEGTSSDLKNLKSCQGLVGSIGGREGKCFADKTCGGFVQGGTRDYSLFDVGTGTDFYFQYIGQGWGCEDAILQDKAGKPVTGADGKATQAPYCCIMLDANENPVSASKINAASAKAMETGTWSYFVPIKSSGDFKEIPATIEMEIADPITFYYKVKQNEPNCWIMPLLGQPTDVGRSPKGGFGCASQADPGTQVVTFGPYTVPDLYKWAKDRGGTTDISELNDIGLFKIFKVRLGVVEEDGKVLTKDVELRVKVNRVQYCSFNSESPCDTGQFVGAAAKKRSGSSTITGTCEARADKTCYVKITDSVNDACKIVYSDVAQTKVIATNDLANACQGVVAPCKKVVPTIPTYNTCIIGTKGCIQTTITKAQFDAHQYAECT
jgi:hypothetical protein